MSDTPETDAASQALCSVRSPQKPNGTYASVSVVLSDFARKLERERNEARERLAIELGSETCIKCGGKWNPSLVESGWCIFCIQREIAAERDQLRKVADELATQLDVFHSESPCYRECPAKTAFNNYNSLPHVIERNKSK